MKDHLSLAFNNLKRRKLRSWLTMIGIFIGIAAVIALVSLGQGLQNYITEEFEKLGKDKIIIMPKTMSTPGSVTSESLMLTTDDLKIIEDVRGVDWAIGFLTKQDIMHFREEATIVYTIGTNPDELDLLEEMQSYEILEGRNLKEGDKYKIVVGYNHAYGKIWERNLEIGDKVEIEGTEFEVVGIMDKIGNAIDDASVYLPKEILKEILNTGNEESQIMAKTAQGFDPKEVSETIERKLRQSKNEKEGQETFTVQTSEQLLNTFQSIFSVVQAVLVGIAAISLLVGGIGIMNTMYTSVLERTREIGTMKAVGAKNSDILMIFLFESGLLGLVGGAIGIAIGIALSKSAEYIATVFLGTNLLRADTSLALVLGALAFSFLIGTLSGIFPAMKAAKLKPVDALRYD